MTRGISGSTSGPLRWNPPSAPYSGTSPPVSAAAGILCLAKPGEWLEAGQPLLELRADRDSVLPGAHAALANAVEIGPEPPAASPLVIDRIS